MPARLLIVLPSWVGDAVMATPALRRVRAAMPGAFIGALARPGVDQLLQGLTDDDNREVFDEFHVDRPTGVLGPKRVAARVRPRRYDTALLLTGSFSTALVTRVAGIPRRIGYARDARGFLLTESLHPPKTPDGSWAIVPAVSYYWHAASALLDPDAPRKLEAPPLDRLDRVQTILPPDTWLSLNVTDADREAANDLLAARGVDPSKPFAILNPGGNKPEKRWPTDRFAAIADHLASEHGVVSLINGSPAEAELCAEIAAKCATSTNPVTLPGEGHSLRTLLALCASDRCRLMLTNDTGPRHIAAAVGCPLISLFGPTDARWTTIPTRPLASGSPGETILVADPTLSPTERANDHPDTSAITHIQLDQILSALTQVLATASTSPWRKPGANHDTPPPPPKNLNPP
ncbi:MAG: hypothetical protein CMJ31_13250 [Phycisphaerae bacterium]|nr:hypothetical protein [Phycisphaerae bacterium]